MKKQKSKPRQRTAQGVKISESVPGAEEKPSSVQQLAQRKWVRHVYNAVGIFSLILGIIGIVTPVLPTTPFILLSGYCFARGSEKMYAWIMGHRYFGPLIKTFRDEKRIPLKIKIFATVMLVTTISITAFFIVPLLAVKIGMGTVGLAVIIYIWTYPN